MRSGRRNAASLGVEQVDAALVKRQREALADSGVGHAQAFTDGNEGAVRARIEHLLAVGTLP